MKIGILSDTHDQLGSLDRALELFVSEGTDRILHLGDWCSPFVVRRFGSLALPVDGIFGNNDGDPFKLVRTCPPNVTIHDRFVLLDLDGFKSALFHGDPAEVTEALAESGRYDLVLTGHNHVRQHRQVGKTHVINPGSLVGPRDGYSATWTEPSVCIVDTALLNKHRQHLEEFRPQFLSITNGDSPTSSC